MVRKHIARDVFPDPDFDELEIVIRPRRPVSNGVGQALLHMLNFERSSEGRLEEEIEIL
jgi:hypothetical protein